MKNGKSIKLEETEREAIDFLLGEEDYYSGKGLFRQLLLQWKHSLGDTPEIKKSKWEYFKTVSKGRFTHNQWRSWKWKKDYKKYLEEIPTPQKIKFGKEKELPEPQINLPKELLIKVNFEWKY